jgi:predicted lipoprotein
MRRFALAISVLVAPLSAQADTTNAVVNSIVADHILPRFEGLADSTNAFAEMALQDCNSTSVALRAAYGDAFDAWISASHLRFGPTEVDDRAFALAFWPDSRGATPRTLTNLLTEQDPIASSAQDYAQVSIAARGFYAMEFLLYDEKLMSEGGQGYHCQLVQTISADMAATSQGILEDWKSDYASKLQNPEPTGVYRSEAEALQELLRSLSAGLQFTSETRLGRPLGTYDRPRATRAEARRSGRSSHHVTLSLTALQDLASRLAVGNADLTAHLDKGFERALSQLSKLDDPIFAGVSVPQTRIKIEVVQQSIETIRSTVREELGPTLGVAAGFNSLDGD